MFIKSCCLLLLIFSECLTTKITRLEIPALSRLGAGAAEPDLVCEYKLDPEPQGLVVKMDHNGAMVFQWIGEYDAPVVLSPYKSHLDLNRNVSDISERRYFHAMRIRNPVPEFSGNYTCIVSTDFSEDRQSKMLQFFDPGQGPMLQFAVLEGVTDAAEATTTEAREGNKTVQLDCDVTEVYPAPELTITVDGLVVNQTLVSHNTTEGRYNASATASVSLEEVPVGAELRCELVLPGTSFNVTQLVTFNGSPESEEAESARPPAAAVGADSPWAAGGARAGDGSGAVARALCTMAVVLAAAALHRLP